MWGISSISHLLAFLLIFLIAACRLIETSVHEPEVIEDIDPEQAVLKAHMPDGGMYIFEEQWSIETSEDNGETTTVSGEAKKYDAGRELIEKSQVELDVEDVALFETNKVVSNPAVVAKTSKNDYYGRITGGYRLLCRQSQSVFRLLSHVLCARRGYHPLNVSPRGKSAWPNCRNMMTGSGSVRQAERVWKNRRRSS